MRVGLLADTHDAREATRRALARLEDRGAEVLLHAGDLISGRMLELLDGWRVWLARGNGDWVASIEAALSEREVDVRYADSHRLDLDGTAVALVHGERDGRLEALVADDDLDLVVHGHTHAFRDERVDGTRVVNPGAVWRARPPSVCVYDTDGDELERLPLG